MSVRSRARSTLGRWVSPLPLPRPTVRLHLTLLYGALILASGVALLTVTYVLVARNTSGTVFAPTQARGGGVTVVTGGGGIGQQQVITTQPIPGTDPTQYGPPVYLGGGAPPDPAQLDTIARNLTTLARQQRDDQLHQLLVMSGIALSVMLLLSFALGSLIAGRVLRPLRTITATARSISASNLHRRLQLRGPDDELKELGDTVDDLLARLEHSFDAQRQFIANASHELRTPLARQRTMVEVALRDPAPTVESLRTAHERVLAAGEQQERTIEALLTLARTERGLDSRETCDLTAITDEVLLTRAADIEQRGLHLESTLMAAQLCGDPQLVERLVTNLVDNAIRHNLEGGHIAVATGTFDERAVLCLRNTGPVIPAEEIDRLFEPFQRLDADRGARADGVGLGLSIVRAIAAAHGAALSATPLPEGGLDVELAFPGPPSSPST